MLGNFGVIEGDINTDRRRFLIGATSVVGAVGTVGVAVPFVASMNPSAKARAAGAPIKIDISKLRPGERLGPIRSWRGSPVFVIWRSEEMLRDLSRSHDRLQDPDSLRPQQPEYARNETRSIRPEILILVGICTHLGCSPKFRPVAQAEKFDPNWLGGFFCPCHGSKFDMAGRVYKNVPAPSNLPVPPHYYETDSVIVIGKERAGV